MPMLFTCRFHVLVIGTEECERSIEASMINPSKKLWEAVLVDVLGDKYAPLRSHTLQVNDSFGVVIALTLSCETN